LANPFVLFSTAAFAAIAVPSGTWFRRFFGRSQQLNAAAPATTHEEGWTFIKCNDPSSFSHWLGTDQTGLPFRPDEEPSLGSHLLVELFGCDCESLKLESTVGAVMEEAALMSDATVVAKSFHEFKPYGVSGAVIIQESHYTIHTWPEHGYAAVDLFYCGGTVAVHKAVEVLQERFQPKRIKFLVVRRGPQSEVERA
jgi:S-adenosylmethionine decarboxylase